MRISEKQGKNLLSLPLGLVCDFKGEFSLVKDLPEQVKPELGAIHGKVAYYRVISGKVVETMVRT